MSWLHCTVYLANSIATAAWLEAAVVKGAYCLSWMLGANFGKRRVAVAFAFGPSCQIICNLLSLSLSPLSPLSERRSMLFNPLLVRRPSGPPAAPVVRSRSRSLANRSHQYLARDGVGFLCAVGPPRPRPSVTDSMNPPLCTNSRKLFPPLLAQLMGNSRERGGEGREGHGTGTYTALRRMFHKVYPQPGRTYMMLLIPSRSSGSMSSSDEVVAALKIKIFVMIC